MEKKIKVKSIKDYVDNLEDKELMKVAKKIADSFRKLPEYKEWADYKKQRKLNCEMCGIEFDDKVVKPEVHHSSETLTELTFNIMLEQNKEDVYPTYIVLLLRDIHLKDLVETQVLCNCCHKRIHLLNKANK